MSVLQCFVFVLSHESFSKALNWSGHGYKLIILLQLKQIIPPYVDDIEHYSGTLTQLNQLNKAKENIYNIYKNGVALGQLSSL
jgi:hypothetical protein